MKKSPFSERVNQAADPVGATIPEANAVNVAILYGKAYGKLRIVIRQKACLVGIPLSSHAIVTRRFTS
jgi:hypothetical protein